MSDTPGVHQTLIAGTLGAPPVFSALLLLNILLLGIVIGQQGWLINANHDAARELRLLQNDNRDLEDVLIRRGILDPQDLKNPAGVKR